MGPTYSYVDMGPPYSLFAGPHEQSAGRDARQITMVLYRRIGDGPAGEIVRTYVVMVKGLDLRTVERAPDDSTWRAVLLLAAEEVGRHIADGREAPADGDDIEVLLPISVHDADRRRDDVPSSSGSVVVDRLERVATFTDEGAMRADGGWRNGETVRALEEQDAKARARSDEKRRPGA